LVQTDKERKAKQKEYASRPENKVKASKRSTTPEFRAKGEHFITMND